MSDSSIIDRYAKAAFKIAKKVKLEEVFVKDLILFSANTSPFLKELSNPVISAIQIGNIVDDVAKKLKINQEVRHFLTILAKSRRINLISEISKKLESLVKKENNILEVDLISAHKLKAEQVKETTKILKAKYPKNDIEINEIIKEDILGGIVVKIGSFVIDNSIKNQLRNIAAECKATL